MVVKREISEKELVEAIVASKKDVKGSVSTNRKTANSKKLVSDVKEAVTGE